MHGFRYVRNKTHGIHNFDGYQIFVAEMRDTKQGSHPGILALHAGSMGGEVPFPLSATRAQDLSRFLRAAYAGHLPASHVLKGGLKNYFHILHVTFKRQESDAGGVSLVGRMKLGNCMGYQSNQVKIPVSTLLNCAEDIEAMYVIQVCR